jgi:hypothetical protein
MTKKTIKEWVLEEVKDETLHLEEVVKYGCVNGSVSSLIYYSDTVKFYDEFKDEIWEMLDEESAQTGFSIPFNMSNWNGCKNITSEDTFKNALAWYAVEETCRKLLDEKEQKEVA